ncbi:hypothetical protein AALP_AA2G163900 [Arabis alpina]|uniref:TIR domain-containing protein n=1 Tax=Arabis alpina TaxID=50452 RepID=A0A087HHW2_ARAAL|nr:hypothetical protein AALP_AA2G163900 [Arabis alpina]
MASSPSSSSSDESIWRMLDPSPSSKSPKYEVFLSFRRQDTRRTFVSHLYRALDQEGIRTYRDENQQTGDGRISPEVAQAINESKIAVVVMSANYASSSWCLDILATIMESSMVTKAVFYEVDPDDWRRRTDDFRRHEERGNRWRNALERLESTNPRFSSRDWEDDSKMLDDLIRSISYENVDHRVMSLIPTELMTDIRAGSRADIQTGLKELNTEDDSVTDNNMSTELASLASEDSNGLVGMYRHKKELSICAVHFAGRLPLALEVLGTLLHGKDEESWKRTLRKLEASQDNGSRLVSNYIRAAEYLPRRPKDLEHCVRADKEEHSPSYHMLL